MKTGAGKRRFLHFLRIADREFQSAFLGVILLFSFELLALVFLYGHSVVRTVRESLIISGAAEEVSKISVRSFVETLGVWLLLTALQVPILMLMTNRAAGPIRRLTRVLSEYLADSEKGSSQELIKFRKDDYFKELADLINELIRRKNDRSSKDS